MMFRSHSWILAALLAPAALWGQTADSHIPESAAPADVNAALRASVTQFFEYHKGTINRRAIDLVAEESKDLYFSSAKSANKGFTITQIEYYSKDFNRASVTADVRREIHIEGETVDGISPLVTNWKLEDGKWMWFFDRANAWVTPMGASDLSPIKALENFTTEGKMPADFNTPESMANQMAAILGQAKPDKTTVTFKQGQAGADQVTLPNGFPGSVSLKLYDVPAVPGLKISLEKPDLPRGEKGVVHIEYTPDPSQAAPSDSYTFKLVLDPFAQTFPIHVNFSR